MVRFILSTWPLVQWMGDLGESVLDGVFSHTVGNPPYVRRERILGVPMEE